MLKCPLDADRLFLLHPDFCLYRIGNLNNVPVCKKVVVNRQGLIAVLSIKNTWQANLSTK